MLPLIIVAVIEVLTFLVIREYLLNTSRRLFVNSLTINIMLSVLLWAFIIITAAGGGTYDSPENVSNRMVLAGMICAVVVPRVLLIIFHYSGKLLRLRQGGHVKLVTGTGAVLSGVIFIVIVLGSTAGRFNFKREEITVKIDGLDPALRGLKIVHLSDMHLACFYRHNKLLDRLMKEVSALKPDLIINTGDFINYGWREFGRFDTILSKAQGRYGNFAVLGNHDMGTYMLEADDRIRENIIQKMKEQITLSGYHLLNDENILININGSTIALTGVHTSGRHPDIFHGDLIRAMEGIENPDLKILLAHDPNQWKKDVTGKTDINLTLSGHTHGMQMGILTKKIRWSPAQYFYPQWNGLYKDGEQYLYVNRGLGVLAIPFRILMPPEITIINLTSD